MLLKPIRIALPLSFLFCAGGITAQNNTWMTTGNSNVGSNAYLGTNDSSHIDVKTNAVSRLHIGPDGKIGIGTTNPIEKLDIASGSIRGLDYAGQGVRLLAVDSSGKFITTGIGLKEGGAGGCSPVVDGWGLGVIDPTVLHLCGPYTRVQIGEQGVTNYNNLSNLQLDVRGDLKVGGQISVNSLAGGTGLHVVFADQQGKLVLAPSIGMDPFWGTFGTNVNQGMFLGSTNNVDLEFKTNNQLRMKLSNVGKVTITDLAGQGSSPVLADPNGQLVRSSGGAFWATTGNQVSSGQVLGSNNNQPLTFVTSGLTRFQIGSTGEAALNAMPNTGVMLNIQTPWNSGVGIRSKAMSSNQYASPTCFQAIVSNDVSKAFVVKNESLTGNGCPPGQESFRVWGDGKVEARRVKVTLTGWCDYVFDPEYHLVPLEEVNSYIQANGHLPELPTTETVLREGLDLGEMEALLLKKIEELTLYAIEQQDRIRKMETEIEHLKTNTQTK